MPIPGIPDPAVPYGSTIVITGCSGFIGSHVTDQVLSAGYKVRGTSRDVVKNKWVADFFAARHGEGKFELVEVPDLTQDDAFAEVVKGAQGFIHVAHEMRGSGDPATAIPLAVGMALSALKTASAAGIQRFVYTSSSFAVTQPKPDIAFPVGEDMFNEEAVQAVQERGKDAGGATVYAAAKVAVERAMQSWLKEHKSGIVVNCVNPNANLGPVLQPQYQGYPTTANWVKSIWGGEYGALKRQPEHFIDVRDDAKLHVIALVHPALRGRRLLGMVAPAPVDRIIGIMRGLFPEREFGEFEVEGEDRIENSMKGEVEALLREAYGHGYTGLEESVEANARELR